jgi:hypothetical protein
MKRPFTKEDRIASASSIENLQAQLVKFYFGSSIKIEGIEDAWAVHNAKGLMAHVGIFREPVRGQNRFWAYFRQEAE